MTERRFLGRMVALACLWLLCLAAQLRKGGCCGQRGANRDYAVNTHQSLQERGVHDARLARLVYQLRAGGPA